MKLIIISTHVTRKSPGMRALVGAFPGFRELFDSIEVWATESELDESVGVKWIRFPQRMPVWRLHALDFHMRIEKFIRSVSYFGDSLVLVDGCYSHQADIRYIHFWHNALLEELRSRPKTFSLGILNRIPSTIVAGWERKVVKNPNATRSWWVVSRSMAERIKSEGAQGEFHILPNQYNPLRFNLGERDKWRTKMRNEYGFSPDVKVFVFASYGHFERKGLVQAAQAVTLLHKRGLKVKLLVLGGTPSTVASFKGKAGGRGIDLNVCHFAGLVEDIERHLSAADGFLFPSNFEVFSLSEIEAAALGLRLYLTNHYGQEMILRESVNGRLLPWDSEGMAGILENEILTGAIDGTHNEIGEAVDPEEFSARIISRLKDAICQKKGIS